MPIDYEREVAEYEKRKSLRSNVSRETRDSGTSGLVNPEEWLLQAVLGRVASSTGITVTPLRAMGVSTVFACVRVRSETMASLPCCIYRPDGRGGMIEARDHRMFSVLRHAPNKEMSAYDFMATLIGHLTLRQNAFAEVIRDGDGDPVGLYPIDPMDISVIRDSRTMNLFYKFMRNGTDFKLEDILHLRGYSRSGLVGIDMTTNLQEVFALAIALQDNAAKFFGNGSRPNAVLTHPNVLSAEAQERLRNQVEDSTGGRNTYRTLILEEAMTYEKSRSENKDSQFQEAREYQDLQICRAFRVPPHKAGITGNAPRANVEQENLSFVTDTIRPDCVNVEQQLEMKILTETEREQGYCVRFNLDALMRGDMKSRYESYAVGRQWGFLSVNDIRRQEQMSPVDGGNTYLQPLNMVPLGTLPSETGVNTPGKTDLPGGGDDAPADGAATPPKGTLPAKDPGTAPVPLPKLNVGDLPKKPKEIAVTEDSSILKV